MKCRPLKPSRQQPEMKKKDTMNENIIYLLKYTLLFYEVMGRKTRTVNHRFQVHAGSCPPWILVDLELCPFLGLPCVCLSRNVMEFSTDVYIMEKFTYKTDTLVWIKHIIGFLFWWTFRKMILICLKSYDIHTFHFKMPRT